jgi:hypothetical protein
MLTNVHQIDQVQYASLLDFTIASGGNLLVFGQAGGGKTEMAKQAVERADCIPIYINLAVLEPTDLVGLPIIDRSGKHPQVVYASPKFLPRKDENNINGKAKYVAIFDELDKAAGDLQNPLLEILQTFSINGVPLDIRAAIMTGNLPDEGAFSKPVNQALTNRCLVYRLNGTTDAWLKWANDSSLNFLVTGFIGQNTEWLNKQATEGDPTDYTRPSPRSWTKAAYDLDKAMMEKSTDTVDFLTTIVSGRVGNPAALKFRVWLDHYRHIHPEIEKLATTGKHPDSMPVDRLFVASISAMEAIRRTSQNRQAGESEAAHIKRVHKVASYVCSWLFTLGKEYQVAALKSVVSATMLRDFKLVEVKEFTDISRQIYSAIRGI